ncbi:MAG TPA: TSUP family transporter, partial [Pseudobdellovibrionaceae bacterium]|nr:TSUP family transporter [Pseudobdellovibrionaceae bacterium]
MLEVFGFIGALFMGLSLGLIGGGGSILSVPIFVYLFGVKPELATAYSLFVVGLTALLGSLTYIKNKMVNFKVGFIFAIPAFVGVFTVRKFVMPVIPKEIIQ